MPHRGAILDVDGTVLRGDEALPGADAGLAALADADVRRVFFSNNPTKAPPAYEARFERAGLDVAAEEVLTAGSTTTSYLAAEHANARVYVLGEAGLVDQVRDVGVDVVDDPAWADVFVGSLDRSFDYDDLSEALWALADDEITFLGTDPDMVIPGAERDFPGSGAVLNAVAGVTGRDPEHVLGKPSEQARRMALDHLGVDAEECLVVGDRLDTDIALGADAGMTTVLVRTGITDDAALAASDVEPDHVLDSIGDIARVLDTD